MFEIKCSGRHLCLRPLSVAGACLAACQLGVLERRCPAHPLTPCISPAGQACVSCLRQLEAASPAQVWPSSAFCFQRQHPRVAASCARRRLRIAGGRDLAWPCGARRRLWMIAGGARPRRALQVIHEAGLLQWLAEPNLLKVLPTPMGQCGHVRLLNLHNSSQCSQRPVGQQDGQAWPLDFCW